MPLRLTLVLALSLVLATTPILSSQAVFPDSNGKALAGLTTVDAIASIDTWLEMEGDRTALQRNIQTAFELGLRRDGLRVDRAAPNYLFCEIKFAKADAIIAYAYKIAYYSFEETLVHRLLWTSGGIVTVGRSRFSADSVAKDCVDRFANEWLKWNPRR